MLSWKISSSSHYRSPRFDTANRPLEECNAGVAAMEEVVSNPVPLLVGLCGQHWIGSGDHAGIVLLGEFGLDVGVELLAAAFAEVVQHAAGTDHVVEVRQLGLGAALQAAPPPLEPLEGALCCCVRGGDALVEGVLRPCQVLVRVRHEHPVRERVARAAHQPALVVSEHAGLAAGVQRGPLEHGGVGQRAREADAYVREGAVSVHDGLHGDGIGGLVVPLREAAVVVLGDVVLGWADGDVVGVHGADDAGNPGHGLEPGGGGFQRPADGLGQEDGGEGGADLEDDVVAGGDAEAEAAGDLAEGLPGGEAPEADRDALVHGYGSAQRGVLLGDGGAELVAERVEGGARHAEGLAELGVRARRAAEAVPPLRAPLPHPHPPAPAPCRWCCVAAAVGRRGGRRALHLPPDRLRPRRAVVSRGDEAAFPSLTSHFRWWRWQRRGGVSEEGWRGLGGAVVREGVGRGGEVVVHEEGEEGGVVVGSCWAVEERWKRGEGREVGAHDPISLVESWLAELARSAAAVGSTVLAVGCFSETRDEEEDRRRGGGDG
ncbi:hypothetical protein CFC21_006101 [Triticum aestivum]|uniref:Uncharacterized protein n=2 Tax=Triticum aestivum TaxID=4565 RepID=A0A3B5YUM7_WHEAT|nr:hypothetical protein CFC21_006101 [Triticum aestivum]